MGEILLRRPPLPLSLLCLIVLAAIACSQSGESARQESAPPSVTYEPQPDSLSRPSPTAADSFIAQFPRLARLSHGWGTVLYPPEGTEVINKLRSELPPSHPLYLINDFSADDRVLLRRVLPNASGKPYFLVSSDGPSGDPEFYLADAVTGLETSGVWGEVLAISADGELTMFQRTNSDFPKRKRVLVEDGELKDAPQSRFVLNFRSIVLDSLRLERSEHDRTVVARLARGDSVVVLEAAGEGEMLLWLQTARGVRGFVRLPSSQCPRAIVRGLCYLGD